MGALRRARASLPAGALLAAALLGGAGCAGPVVKEQRVKVVPGALARVAVAPFVAAPRIVLAPEPEGPTPLETADLVGRFVSEALEAEGVEVVPPSDVQRLFEAQGALVPHAQPTLLAVRAAEEFGATAVLLGTVHRYVERRGESLGALRPPSVSFELALHRAPSGELLWKGRVDETQHALTANVSRALDYPGAGTRWLTVAELARWAAAHAAGTLESLP